MTNGKIYGEVCAIDLMPGDRLPEGFAVDGEPDMMPLTVTEVHRDKGRTEIVAVDDEGDAWWRAFDGNGQFSRLSVERRPCSCR